DGLVGHVQALIVREGLLQPTRDLLRRPVELQLLRDPALQRLLLGQLAVLRTPGESPCLSVSLARPVRVSAPVSLDLARDRRWRTSKPPRDAPQRAAST